MIKKRTFFIVDDDIDDQELFIEAVKEVDSSIECLSSSDCEHALNLLKNGEIAIPDIIFLDLNMPRLNGKQCLVELKKRSQASAYTRYHLFYFFRKKRYRRNIAFRGSSFSY